MLEIYKDLWKTKEKRENMVKYRIANENTRKLMSKDDSANKATKTDGVLDLTITNIFERMKIPLAKILCDNGPYAPYDMFNFEYLITLPPSKKIMKAQDGEDVGKYKLEDILLEYDVIDSEDLVKEVRDQYSIGRSLGYDYVTLYETQNWDKKKTIGNVSVNIPRKSMKAVVLLFTEEDAGDSESFPSQGLQPNALYSKLLIKQDMYEEAERFFGMMKNPHSDNVSCTEFFTDKFLLVIDLRTVDDESVSGSGRKILGNKAGIKIEIKKEVTTTDLNCHVFVIAVAIVNIVGNGLQGVEY